MTDLTLTSTAAPPARTCECAEHGDATVLTDERAARAYALNDTALALWELCDGGTTVAEMVGAASMLFAEDPDDLRARRPRRPGSSCSATA